jgi:hypothetical protein
LAYKRRGSPPAAETGRRTTITHLPFAFSTILHSPQSNLWDLEATPPLPPRLQPPFYEHHSASNTVPQAHHCWTYGPVQNQDKSSVLSCLAPAIERQILALITSQCWDYFPHRRGAWWLLAMAWPWSSCGVNDLVDIATTLPFPSIDAEATTTVVSGGGGDGRGRARQRYGQPAAPTARDPPASFLPRRRALSSPFLLLPLLGSATARVLTPWGNGPPEATTGASRPPPHKLSRHPPPLFIQLEILSVTTSCLHW